MSKRSRLAVMEDLKPPKQGKMPVKIKKLQKATMANGGSDDYTGAKGTSSLPLERRKNLERGGKLKKQTKNKYPRAGSSW